MDNFTAGIMGFFLGRATAPEPVAPRPEYVRPALPAPVVHVTVVEYPGDEITRLESWRPFDPLLPACWARREDGVPAYPRFGRRWKNEYRAEYLYWLYEGDTLRFPQTTGADMVRDGPGWVLLRDEPAWGWRVSEPLEPEALAPLLTAPVPPEKAAQDFHPWGTGAPLPLPLERLAAPGWWDPEPVFGVVLDPAQYLDAAWLRQLAFT